MMARLIAAEWMKTRTRWLPWVLLVVLILGAGVQIWLFGYTAWWDLHNETDPELRSDLPIAIRTFALPWAIPALLDSGQYWGSVILGVLIASVVATEYNWGTVRHAIARGQSREQFLTVKLVGLALFATVLMLIAFTWGIASMIWTSNLAGIPVTLNPPGAAEMTLLDIVIAMLRAAMGILPYALLAFAMTTIGRSTALGATGIILFIIIESTIIGIFAALGGIWEDLLIFSIGQNAASLIAANRIDDGEYASLALRGIPDASELPDPWVAFVVLCLWCVLLLGVTYWVFRRRDLRLGTGE
jgi:ABC-type transport system involved in multi-copper enzyme maturation permease subunit